jgi:hypothetical protein
MITTYFNILKLCFLPQSVYAFRKALDCFTKQHLPVYLCRGAVICFLWGMNWISIYCGVFAPCKKCWATESAVSKQYTYQQWKSGVTQSVSRLRLGKHIHAGAWRHTPIVLARSHVTCSRRDIPDATIGTTWDVFCAVGAEGTLCDSGNIRNSSVPDEFRSRRGVLTSGQRKRNNLPC